MATTGLSLVIFTLIGCFTFVHAAEQCDGYYKGNRTVWALCPNYCCGSATYRICCEICSQAYPSRVCLSAGAIIGIVIGGILAVLAVAAVIYAIFKCCAAQQMAEDAAMVPPPPEMTVITTQGVAGSPYQGGPMPQYFNGPQPYPGPQPPAYGPPGYNQQVAPAPNVIVVNQSRPPPAPVMAPMPLIMPVPIGGFGDYHHHHHHYGGGGGGYGGGIDAPIATGNYGGGGGGDMPIASGFSD